MQRLPNHCTGTARSNQCIHTIAKCLSTCSESLQPLTWCRHVELSSLHLKMQSLLRGGIILELITALYDCVKRFPLMFQRDIEGFGDVSSTSSAPPVRPRHQRLQRFGRFGPLIT